MRTPFIAGNWKMNLTVGKARELVSVLDKEIGAVKDVEVLVAPPLTALAAVISELHASRIEVAAQNCHWEAAGAFTGEVSPELIRDLGCSHVIIGHSERRQYFGETDETVNKKIQAAFRAGLGDCLYWRDPCRARGRKNHGYRGDTTQGCPERCCRPATWNT